MRNTSLPRRTQRQTRLLRASKRLQTESNDHQLLHLRDLDTNPIHTAFQIVRHSLSTSPDHLDSTTLPPPDRYPHTPIPALAQPTINCILDSTKLLLPLAKISRTPWSPQALQHLEQALLANRLHLLSPKDAIAIYHPSILGIRALRSQRRKRACVTHYEIPKRPHQRVILVSTPMANTRKSVICDPSIPINITKVSHHSFPTY